MKKTELVLWVGLLLLVPFLPLADHLRPEIPSSWLAPAYWGVYGGGDAEVCFWAARQPEVASAAPGVMDVCR